MSAASWRDIWAEVVLDLENSALYLQKSRSVAEAFHLRQSSAMPGTTISTVSTRHVACKEYSVEYLADFRRDFSLLLHLQLSAMLGNGRWDRGEVRREGGREGWEEGGKGWRWASDCCQTSAGNHGVLFLGDQPDVPESFLRRGSQNS
eukprot:2457978-Rhodomonas_salina.7